MNKLFCLLCLLIVGFVSQATTTDSLLQILDNALNNRAFYINKKIQKIDSLKKFLINETNEAKLYELNKKIIEEYRFYSSDSTLQYINKNKTLAEKAKNSSWLIECQLQYARLLSSVGIFNEALKTLEQIPEARLPYNLKLLYYMAYEELYVHELDFIDDKQLQKKYEHELVKYRAAAMQYFTYNSPEYFFWIFKDMYLKHNFKVAEQALKACLKKVDPNSHLFAGANYCMSLLFEDGTSKQEINERIKYLAIAAISDIQLSTKENVALFSLSNVLQQSGEIQRAYRYVHVALDDANFFNARYRNLQIAKVLPIIENAYQVESLKQKNRLRIALTVISFLSIGLIISILFLRKHMNSLVKARAELNHANEQLKKAINNLNKANSNLSESNKIKEIYIGHFLNLCSTYIEKIEDFQKVTYKNSTLKRSSLVGEKELASVSQVVETALKNFYDNFDNAFLVIFPDFVEKFNELMPKQEMIIPRPNEKLTTELRIFALIRLGVTDSNQIAALLRYSLTTIYTYRSRIRNKSLFHNDFESKIMEIGSNIN